MLPLNSNENKVYQQGELLTPAIKFTYADVKCLNESQVFDTQGYFIFEGKSRANNQVHQIRALNLNSPLAQQDINQVITIFLQETLRLCSLCPDCILWDTLEYQNGKICYAMKATTPVRRETSPQLDVGKLLTQVLTDFNYLSRRGGEISIIPSQIYQIYSKHNEDDCFLVQDWNNVLWTSKGKGDGNFTTVNASEVEKVNVYNLAKNIGSFFVNRQSMTEEDSLIKQSTSIEEIMSSMLHNDPEQRPTFEKIIATLTHLSKEEQTNMNDPFFEEQKISNPDQTDRTIRLMEGSELESQKYFDDKNNPLAVKKISLYGKNIGAEGAIELSKNTSWTNLTTLDLSVNNIGDKGAIAISKNTMWKNSLIYLILSKNNISAEGAIALFEEISWNNLKVLNISDNLLGDDGMRAFQKTSFPEIKALNLSSNLISDIGVDALVGMKIYRDVKPIPFSSYFTNVALKGDEILDGWETLTTLYLSGNLIGDEGAITLANAKLKTLNLSGNRIGVEGAIELSKSRCLATLDLSENNIGFWTRNFRRWPKFMSFSPILKPKKS